jgi:YD repeat-containing protein
MYAPSFMIIDAHFGHRVKMMQPYYKALLKTVSLPNDQTITYHLDAAHQITRVEYPDGTTVHYTYEVKGTGTKLTQAIDGNGQVVSEWKYDDQGRAISNVMHR